jgi:type VI secretion system protein ImpH
MLDLVSERMFADLAEAGIRYRMERAAEAARLSSPGRPSLPEYALLALAGFSSPSMLARLKSGRRSILYYAGLFAAGPRSADRLAALAADWLGHPVEIVEFVGAWLSIDKTEQTRLPQGRSGGAHCRLGMDATAAARVWDPHVRVTLRIGPLGGGAFEALLRDQDKLAVFADLVRAYLGVGTTFRVNLVLKVKEVTHARLADGDTAFARLGWNSWLQPQLSRVGVDADDVAFAL